MHPLHANDAGSKRPNFEDKNERDVEQSSVENTSQRYIVVGE